MKVKDLELGRLFVATEPYSKHEDFYMKIQCSYEGANAVRLRDGIAIKLNAFADVTELGVDLVEYLKGIYEDVIQKNTCESCVYFSTLEFESLDGKPHCNNLFSGVTVVCGDDSCDQFNGSEG